MFYIAQQSNLGQLHYLLPEEHQVSWYHYRFVVFNLLSFLVPGHTAILSTKSLLFHEDHVSIQLCLLVDMYYFPGEI